MAFVRSWKQGQKSKSYLLSIRCSRQDYWSARRVESQKGVRFLLSAMHFKSDVHLLKIVQALQR